MNTLIRINYGDCGGDGHKVTDSSLIRANKTATEVREAYRKGATIIGFDLTETVAREYEDDTLPEDNASVLLDHGIDLSGFDSYTEDLEDITLMGEEFVELYLKICQLGDPDFLYEYTKMSEIDIGGYGLFWG